MKLFREENRAGVRNLCHTVSAVLPRQYMTRTGIQKVATGEQLSDED